MGLAVARKERLARAVCERENLFFIPLAVETFGGWDIQALDTFKRISSALARYEGLEEGVVSNQFVNRLSVQLMRQCSPPDRSQTYSPLPRSRRKHVISNVPQ